MTKIVVLGGSFGGLIAAFELKRLLGKKVDVTVVSDSDRFVFMPSLPWIVMGWRKPEDITLGLSEMLKPKGIAFLHEAAKQIDADSSKVYTTTRELSYDYLVIATGPRLMYDEIPGLGPEKGFTECTFTLDHAVKAAQAWKKVLESPGPIVVGSSQMVSCLGPAYELVFEMDAELRRLKMRHKVPITYLTPEPFLGHMGVGGLRDLKRFVETEFAERDIKPLVGQAIEEITPGEIKLKGGAKVPFKLAVITPPFKGVPAVAPLGNPRGFIQVDKNYRHTKYKNLFAVGVAIALVNPEATPVPTGVFKTGYMTEKMAKVAAATISSEVLGKTAPLADELDVMCFLDMGNTALCMKAYPILPPRQNSYVKKAIWVKWLKLCFEKYYLFKMKHGLSNWH